MKRGRDEEKITGPLFPRLHVNDTEKGGPRAPPRNKMALYELLSIPSQRFNPRLAPTLPLPPNNSCTSVSSISSSQSGGHERSVLSPFYLQPPTSTHSAGKLHSSSSDGANLNGTMAEFDRKSTKNVNHRPSNATTGLLSTSDRSSCHSHAFSNLRKRIPGDEDDLRVPVFVHSQVSPCSDKDIPNTSRERFSPFISTNSDRSTVAEDNSPLKTAAATCNSSMQPQNACDKSQKPTRTTDMKSKQHVRNQFKENLKETVTGKNHAENSTSISSMGERIAEPLKHDKTSGNQELQNGQVGSRRLCDADAERHQENGSAMFPKICGDADVHLVEPNEVEKENISRERNESCSEASPVNSHRNPERAENGGHYHEEMVHESLQVGDVDGNDDASESSMVDSVLGADISPDDAVGVIGKKRFWKARRAIVNNNGADHVSGKQESREALQHFILNAANIYAASSGSHCMESN